MLILDRTQLSQLLPTLKTFRPKVLQVESMIRNHLSGICAWPGVEFVADQFPEFNVIICRPIKDSEEYVGRSRGAGITLFSRDDTILEAMIAGEDSCIDWSVPFIFIGVPKWTTGAMLQRIGRSKGTISENRDDEYCVVFIMDPAKMTVRPLPPGLVLGELSECHAEQLSAEWKYGSPAMLPYFRFLLRSKFPNAALFEEKSNTPIAYTLYSLGDGSIGTAFTREQYRGLGLIGTVYYHTVKKIQRDLEQDVVFGYVDAANTSSLKGLQNLGAQLIDTKEWAAEFVQYMPKDMTGFFD